MTLQRILAVTEDAGTPQSMRNAEEGAGAAAGTLAAIADAGDAAEDPGSYEGC